MVLALVVWSAIVASYPSAASRQRKADVMQMLHAYSSLFEEVAKSFPH